MSTMSIAPSSVYFHNASFVYNSLNYQLSFQLQTLSRQWCCNLNLHHNHKNKFAVNLSYFLVYTFIQLTKITFHTLFK